MRCQNCGQEMIGNFCTKCGQPAQEIQTKSPSYYTGQIISMFLVIAGLFGIVLSISPLSSVRVMNGQITPVQAIIANPLALLKTIPDKDMSKIAWFLIPLFYFSLVLLIAASIFSLLKRISVKNILASVSFIFTVLLGVFVQSPVYYFVFLNIGLLIFMLLLLIESHQHKLNICWAITLPIFLGNKILLIVRLFIVAVSDAMGKVLAMPVLVFSVLNVFMLLLWCIPCIVNIMTLFRLKGNPTRYTEKN